jgi:hypothetical protein
MRRCFLSDCGKTKIKLSLCLTKHYAWKCILFLIKYDAMKTYRRSEGIAPYFPNLGNILRWVVSFTSRPPYSRDKDETHPFLSNSISLCTTENTTDSRNSVTNTFQTSWRSEININLKTDADALNRRRRRFCVCRKMCHIYQGQRKQHAGKCACVYNEE